MAREEDELARLEAASVDMDTSEVVRHARYAAEDAATAIVRKHEDDLHAQGLKVREDMKASLEAAIARRKAAEAAQSPEMITELLARIAHLEAAQKPAEATVAPPADQ